MRQHDGGGKVALNLNDRPFGIDDVEIRHGVNFIESLSREITSWVGISITWMRKSTRTSWKKAISSTKPGPFTPSNFPRVKTMAAEE